MMTSPRPVPTINQSLASFRAAGFTDPVLIVEDKDRIGALQAWQRAAHLVMRKRRRNAFVGIMEDDILWARNAANVLHQEIELMGNIALTAGYLSPFAFNKHVLEPRRETWRGWHVSRLGFKSAGAQCYIVPRRSLRKLLDETQFQVFCREPPRAKHGADHIVSGMFYQMNRKCWFRIPCLVNHKMGTTNSSMGHAVKDCDDLAWQEEARLGAS